VNLDVVNVEEIAYIQEVTSSTENEAKVPKNLVYWSFTLRDVDVGNFSLHHDPKKDLGVLWQKISSINSSI